MKSKLKAWVQLENSRSILLLLFLMLGLNLFFSLSSEFYFTKGNLLNILRQVSEIGLMSIPAAILIISGSIDMSMGSSLGLCAILFGMMMLSGVPLVAAILLTLVIGAVLGFFNGYFVAKLNLPAIVSTIGTLVLFRGLCYIANEGRPVNGFSSDLFAFGNASFFSIPISFLILLVLYIVAYVVMTKTAFGLYVYAIGNNEETSRFSGVPVHRFKWLLFVINGIIIALASVFMLSRLGSAEATLGTGYDLEVLTMILIGGISIWGGKGNIAGAFLGLITVGILRNGLNLMGVSVLYQSIMLGVLIILTAAEFKRKRQLV